MLLRCTFRVYPTAPQRQALARTFGCVRTVFNDAVAARARAGPAVSVDGGAGQGSDHAGEADPGAVLAGRGVDGAAPAGAARLHEVIKNQWDDSLHKQAATIIGENQAVYVEDLNVQGLARGRGAKSLHDAAFGRFLTLLESKAARTDRTCARVDRFNPRQGKQQEPDRTRLVSAGR